MKREKVPQDDDIQYRDYLLEVVDRAITKPLNSSAREFEHQLSDIQIRELTLQTLRKELKQDFSTKDKEVIDAYRVPLEVLQTALQEDYQMGFGWAFPPGVPMPSDRQLLNSIFSNCTSYWCSRENLGRKYHIDFSRPYLEKTTPVRENILTLQSYLRDGKFDGTTDYNPFFLYKEEWRRRGTFLSYGGLTPSFLEAFDLLNYNFKRGLFATEVDRRNAEDLVKYVNNHRDCSLSAKNFILRTQILLGIDEVLIEGHKNFAFQEYELARGNYLSVSMLLVNFTANMEIRVYVIPPDGSVCRENNLIPDLSSAEHFCRTLDPANDVYLANHDNYLFARRPNIIGSNTWRPWKDVYGGEHEGDWSEGLRKGWWDPIDKTPWDPITMDIPAKKIPSTYPYTSYLFDRLHWRYSGRAKEKIGSPDDLNKLVKRNVVTVPQPPGSYDTYEKLEIALLRLHDDLVSLVPHIMFFMLPLCQGDLAAITGDFPSASNYYAQIVREPLLRASLKTTKTPDQKTKSEAAGDLPWGWIDRSWTSPSDDEGIGEALNGRNYPYFNQFAEDPIMQLRLGKLYLNWAEYFYREDKEAAVYRARELYKAILRLYGEDPVPKPVEPNDLPGGTSWWGIANFARDVLRPAISSQKDRARIGMEKIDAELNYLGYPHNLVPHVKYGALIEDAKEYFKSAKEKAGDYFTFKNEAEKKTLELIENFKLSEVAKLIITVADEREVQAKNAQSEAEYKVKWMQEAISAKHAAIADSDSFCGQVKDYFSGMKDFLSTAGGILPEGAKKAINDDYGALKSESLATLGFKSGATVAVSGFGIVGGMALFAVGTSFTLSGIADSANAQLSELRQLEEQMLLAQANLDTCQRGVKIAQLQKQIAELETQTNQKILERLKLQEFNAETCYSIAIVKKELLHQYLDLAAKYLWLARQALIYEQAREEDELDPIPFNSFYKYTDTPVLLPDSVEICLTDLKEKYREGQQPLFGTPSRPLVQYTVSLSGDFPLAFAQLKTKGCCTFVTNTELLNLRHPSHFSYRICSVSHYKIVSLSGTPPVGELRNPGISRVEREEIGDWHTLVGFRDGDRLPLSIQALPGTPLSISYPTDTAGEILMPFEGMGFNTLWELKFTLGDLRQLSDVYLTFNLAARSSSQRERLLEKWWAENGSPQKTNTILISAKTRFPDLLNDFVAGEGDVELKFPITDDLIQRFFTNEQSRQVTNIAVFFTGKNLPEIQGTLASQTVPAGVQFTTDGGLVHSNYIPQPAAAVLQVPASPLDPLATGTPVQTWTLKIPDTNTRKKISDVLLGIEYIVVRG